ncbi:MAG: glutamate synthase subunit alpha, partial [Candidatus Omnitrophica bacterium]|nr:glutamate synthase subunit alpha [Candidatus Omnitrophota bacterium]
MMDNRKDLEKFGLYDPRFEHDACGVGFVCDIKGNKSNRIIRQGLDVLRRLSHRGSTGADPNTGDGAGVLIQIPHKFFTKAAKTAKIDLPEQGAYGTGLVFLPVDEVERKYCKDVFLAKIAQAGMKLLGWRSVPLDNTDIGHTARKTQPVIEQVFIAKCAETSDGLAFERELFFLRKQIENTVRKTSLKQKTVFYITNLSSRTFSYKGLFMPDQVEKFFLDLQDQDLESALCLVHSRYSTNTFPTWDLAQPFRYLAHNGEINTLRGNINWMRAREGLLKSEVFKRDLKEIFPIIVPGGSDSASIDNVFELLVLSGRSLPHTMMMLIPGAWERNKLLSDSVKDFYKFHSCFMEPWDGPAAIAFTDGAKIGAVLDRNGLRPARYIITKNNFVVMASEMGVLDIEPESILRSGRLEPGKIFFIDTEAGRIIEDDELKMQMVKAAPYGEWLKNNMAELDAIDQPFSGGQERFDTLFQLKAFGYTREDL